MMYSALRFGLVCWYVVWLLPSAYAQQRYAFPDTPAEFITYTVDLLRKTQKPDIAKTADAFAGVWANGINAEQQSRIIKLSQKLAAAKATVNAMYHPFFSSLAHAIQTQKLSPAQIAEYLQVSDQLADTKNTRDLQIFFDRVDNFLATKALYRSRTNRVYPTGTISFAYIAKRDEALQREFAMQAADPADTSIVVVKDITGPIIKFGQTNLVMASPFDSVAIKDTKGLFLVLTNTWVGKGGKFDWASLDFAPDQVYAEFDAYAYDVARGFLKVTNARMTYSPLFRQKILGDFEFSSRPRKDNSYAVYPKFVSAEADIFIKEFVPMVDYRGGFTLEGRKILSGSRNPNQTSMLIGKYKDESGYKTSFRVWARKFNFADSTISASNSRFSLYLGDKDSIYHASLQFKYVRRNRKGTAEISLVRDRNSISSVTPFIDNYHKFYIDADVVRYDIDRDSLDIYMLAGAQELRPAAFESFDFFNQQRYQEMITVHRFHPTKIFGSFAREKKSDSFYASEVAQFAKQNETTVRGVAADMQLRGYLTYDESSGLITLGKRINQTDSSDLFIQAVDKVRRKLAKRSDSTLYNTRDHDNYRIISVMPDTVRLPNASLKRGENNELIIRGIKRFPISDSLNVNVIPDVSYPNIHMYANRSLYLKKGEVTVGNFRFRGRNFFMMYDDFLLEMPEVDQILFAVKDTTEEKPKYDWYGGEINFNAGQLYINDAKNKSGRKKGKIPQKRDSYEAYPKLQIGQELKYGGVVYFDTEYRQNFAYDSLKVENGSILNPESAGAAFILDPIDLDSLTSKIPIFKGKFVSNIFPEFRETLIPMTAPDNTMGFIHKPPKSGYPLYPKSEAVKGARVSFARDLVMSRDGLTSAGTVSYLSTTLTSPEFVFMPDSVQSDNVEFIVKASKVGNAEFAEAKGKTAQLRWLISPDQMLLTNKDEIERLETSRGNTSEATFTQRFRDKLFTLYGSREPMSLRGTLNISKEGLRGDGNLLRKDFTLLSVSDEPYTFRMGDFTATNVELRINSKNRDPYEYDKGTFYANNKAILLGNFVNTSVNFGAGRMDIKPNPDYSDFTALSLPYSEYRTSIRESVWDMNKQNIQLLGDTTSFFVSTIFGSEDYNEENLTFKAKKGFFDIRNLSLQVEGVPFINSADASIVPKDGKVTILKDAEMQRLKEARVLIDTLNRYHRLFNGNIHINSRLEFEGDATYQFVNVKKDTFNIKFDKFELITQEQAAARAGASEKELERLRRRDDRTKRKTGKEPRFTYAQGEVKEEDKFFITSRVAYKGAVKMYANRKDLALDGFIKLDLQSRDDYDNWLPYKSDKGDAVSLALEEKTKVGNDVITSGLHFTAAYDLYTSFMSPKHVEADIDVFLAKGTLDYSPAINEFKITSPEKRDGKVLAGNQLIYDDSKGEVFLQGALKLWDAALGDKIKTVGNARINAKEKKFLFDVMMPVDMPLSIKPILEMQKRMLEVLPEKPLTLPKNDPLNYKIAELIGDKAFNNFLQESGVKASLLINTSKELKKPLLFGKVDLQWNDEYKTFHSLDSLHILSIGDKMLNRYCTGYVEFRKNASGDSYTIYLQPDPDLWYYFEYEAGSFSALSSDEIFNGALDAKSAQLAAIDKKEAFIAKFRELYKVRDLPKPKEKKEEKKDDKKAAEKKDKKEEDDDGF